MKNKLVKVAYFDEGSAMDLLQIYNNGYFKKTRESLNELSGKANVGGEINANIGNETLGAIISSIFGMSGDANASLGGNGNINTNTISKTVIENSLLSDFINLSNDKEIKDSVDVVSGYKLTIQINSMTYFATISPLTEMINGYQKVDGEDISMDISKMNSVIRNSKGYFELIGKKEGNKDDAIFRFNIDSFKNNYRIQDITRMNLKFFAIEVGKAKKSDLNFLKEFNIQDSVEDNYEDFVSNENNLKNESEDDKDLVVYDVILAGIEK